MKPQTIHLMLDSGRRRTPSTAGMGVTHGIYRDGAKLWEAEQVYGGWYEPGPDQDELRAWVADETELGERVARDFLSTGRCPQGTLDRVFFDRARAMYPDSDPDCVANRRARLGSRCLCQLVHFVPLPPGNGGVHSAPPKGEPLTGLFWTATISYGEAL